MPSNSPCCGDFFLFIFFSHIHILPFKDFRADFSLFYRVVQPVPANPGWFRDKVYGAGSVMEIVMSHHTEVRSQPPSSWDAI